MADIHHDFPIKAPLKRVYEAISTPRGLDSWWTQRSAGQPVEGAEFELWFGPEYDWRAKVTTVASPSEFELQVTKATADWLGTRVGFRLSSRSDTTDVRFYHTGWPTPNEHWRISCYCWTMYLRILRRYALANKRLAAKAARSPCQMAASDESRVVSRSPARRG